MSYVTTINSNQYVGDSLSTINNNFANLETQTNNVTTFTNSVSGNVFKKGYTVSTISNFVYGHVLDGTEKKSTIINNWNDVYINPQKNPLRVSFTNDNYTRKAFLQGKVYTRNVGMAATSFYRLARFNDNTSSTPLEVIDVTACEGNVNYSHGYNTLFQSFYLLQPNITYTFGLQHWWPGSGAGTGNGIQINGWQTNSSDSWGQNSGNTYKYIYANDKTIGYPNTGVNIESYIKLTLI